MNKLIEGITEYCVEKKISTEEFVEFLNQNTDDFGKESQAEISELLSKEDDLQRKFLMLSFIAVVDGTKYEGKDLSEELQMRVDRLNEYVDEYQELLTNGDITISGPERELVVVKRINDNHELESYFNSTKGAIGLEKQADILQNYLVGQLLSNGFVIKTR